MKTLLNAIIIMATLSALMCSALMAEDTLKFSRPDSDAEQFYFPEFDEGMNAFWEDSGLLTHTCSAVSWIGVPANASCAETHGCECTSGFFTAKCKCVDPRSAGFTPAPGS